jgi:outer membrane lipoprotein carrier protein
MTNIFAILWLVLISNCALAQTDVPATDATDRLLEKLGQVESMQGSFLQRQYDEKNSLVGESSGKFRLLRPGYFTWEINSPDSQLITANPTYLWHHDRDLETVTRRPIVDSEQMSPLQVLGGNEDLLRSSFSVEQTMASTFSLHPKGINPGFQRLLVIFNGNVFEGLEIADNLNQRIVIGFENIDSASKLTPEDFAFTPPEGADQFYYDQ